MTNNFKNAANSAISNTPSTITRREAICGLGITAMLASSSLSSAAFAREKGSSAASALLDKIAYNLYEYQPERATGLGVDTGKYAYLRGKSSDFSEAGRSALIRQLKQDLSAVRAFPRKGLDADIITNLDVVESAYSTALDGFALPYGEVAIGSWRNSPYTVIQNVGGYIDMPRMLDAEQPLNADSDVDAYLSRLNAYPKLLQDELARMRAARAQGLIPPDFLIAKTITQMNAAIKDAREGGALVSALQRSTLKGAKEAALEAEAIAKGPVVTALEAQLAELISQQASATSDPGLRSRPHGDEWYAWGLRASTTTRLTPDEVHQRGLEELASLQAQMDPILREIGYTTGSVGERMQALGDDPRYKFSEGDVGREEIMAFLHERVAWIKAQMPRSFSNPVNPNMEIRRIPPNEELGAPGAYGGAGSKDGSIPGKMWINLRTTDLHRKYDLADLAYHETIPGHVWEGEYSNRLPMIRSTLAFNAFSEGWALYAEQLADELGAYDDYKVGRLGYLQSLAFRACRMVVDTGLHHKRWSRAQAVAFFVERNGSKAEEVASEVDRYCSWAGQACGYKVGHSEIVRQRALAEAALGARFNVKAFNDAIVMGGNAPLDVMEKNVARYISQQKSRT